MDGRTIQPFEAEANAIIFKNLVRTAKKIRHLTIKRTESLTLCEENNSCLL
jgi:hypothetical protein